MPEKLFYVRSGTRISGPFPLHQLLRLKEQRLLESDCLISENKIAWIKLDELFAPQHIEPPTVSSAEPETLPLSLCAQEDLKEDKVATESIRETPEFIVEDKEDKSLVLPKPPQKPVEQQLLPDPICATIGLCWAAPSRLGILQLIQKNSESCGTEKKDRNVLYSFSTVFCLTLLLFMATMLCTVLVFKGDWQEYNSEMAKQALGLTETCGILFLGGALLLLLENLLLAIIANLEKILPPFFLAMQFLCIVTCVFMVGTPLWGLYLVGLGSSPAWGKITGWVFSGFAMLFGIINLLRGYIFGCRNIFNFRTGLTVLFSIILTLQVFAIFPAGFLIFQFVQKINFS